MKRVSEKLYSNIILDSIRNNVGVIIERHVKSDLKRRDIRAKVNLTLECMYILVKLKFDHYTSVTDNMIGKKGLLLERRLYRRKGQLHALTSYSLFMTRHSIVLW